MGALLADWRVLLQAEGCGGGGQRAAGRTVAPPTRGCRRSTTGSASRQPMIPSSCASTWRAIRAGCSTSLRRGGWRSSKPIPRLGRPIVTGANPEALRNDPEALYERGLKIESERPRAARRWPRRRSSIARRPSSGCRRRCSRSAEPTTRGSASRRDIAEGRQSVSQGGGSGPRRRHGIARHAVRVRRGSRLSTSARRCGSIAGCGEGRCQRHDEPGVPLRGRQRGFAGLRGGAPAVCPGRRARADASDVQSGAAVEAR